MKKVVSLLAVLFLFAGLASAADSIKGLGTYTGKVDFTGAGAIEFDFVLKGGTSLSWSTSTIATSTFTAAPELRVFNQTDNDAWAVANEYAEVKAKGSKVNFYVYMYQTNTKSTNYKTASKPRENSDGSKVYSGLVNTKLETGEDSTSGDFRGYVPLAYSLVPSQVATKTDDHVYDITFDGTEGTPTDDRANRFFVDTQDKKADGTTAFNKDYTIIAASDCNGPVFGPFDAQGNLKPWGSNKTQNYTAYMYFFGNFKNIHDGDVFGTDQIQIKQVIE